MKTMYEDNILSIIFGGHRLFPGSLRRELIFAKIDRKKECSIPANHVADKLSSVG
eukprot:COSAG06_NODE_3752_length_4945_cov_5.541478_3_plen_55_part_00